MTMTRSGRDRARWSIGLAVLAAALCLAAASRAQDKVNVGIVNAITDAPFYIGVAKGYFREEGLDVRLVGFDAGAKMVAPLGTGELDAGGGAVSVGLYHAVEDGIGLKLVADKAHYEPGYGYAALMVRKDLAASGRFKSLADLKGLKVAVSGLGSTDESVLNEALRAGGLTWGDAQPVYLGFPQHLVAFKNGAIDASLTSEPSVTNILRAGVAVRFTTNDTFYPNQQSTVLIYGKSFLGDRSEDGIRFMRAYLRAVRFYDDALADGKFAGPNASEVIGILTQYSRIKDPALYRAITPSYCDPNGKLNLESMRKDLQFFRDTGQVDGKVGVDDVVDDSFAAAAVSELGPYEPPRKQP